MYCAEPIEVPAIVLSSCHCMKLPLRMNFAVEVVSKAVTVPSGAVVAPEQVQEPIRVLSGWSAATGATRWAGARTGSAAGATVGLISAAARTAAPVTAALDKT